MPAPPFPTPARGLAALAFVATAAAVFIAADEWNTGRPAASQSLFGVWLALHLAFGVAAGSFWILPVALVCVPLAVAVTPYEGYDTPLWIQAGFAELFYGVPVVFIGVIGRRLWQLRRRPELPARRSREESGA